MSGITALMAGKRIVQPLMDGAVLTGRSTRAGAVAMVGTWMNTYGFEYVSFIYFGTLLEASPSGAVEWLVKPIYSFAPEDAGLQWRLDNASVIGGGAIYAAGINQTTLVNINTGFDVRLERSGAGTSSCTADVNIYLDGVLRGTAFSLNFEVTVT